MKLVPLVLAASVGLFAACDTPAPGEADPGPPTTATRTPKPVPASEGSAAGSGAAAAGDETAEIMMRSAAAACADRDYRGLFDAIITSPAVRRAYSAPQVRLSAWVAGRREDSRVVDAAAYESFPIVMQDYYRRPAPSVAGATAAEYIVLAFNQGQNESVAVEWTRVTYDGRSVGGDDLGDAFLISGRPYEDGIDPDGQLLLRANTGCWELVSDDRYL